MEVCSFSEESFSRALSNPYTSIDAIKQKNHFRYLLGYLEKGISAKTLVIEEEYVSKDYLHDYSSYYSLCFEKYPKFCKRIHFFSLEFNLDTFRAFILDHTESDIRGSYLGFIVVKPIPHTVIGFTLLKTYSHSSQFNKRNYWGLKNFPVHLFGIKLEVKSLAFQEQDSVLAACATTAIWSMLSKATEFPSVVLKPPSQITKDSGHISFDGSRLFPNKGLDIRQICEAIFQAGLVSEVKTGDLLFESTKNKSIEVISSSRLKKIINAYSTIGIPIILIISIPNEDEHGYHALTVSGFKQKAPQAIEPRNEVSFQSDNIEKFYAHDDQYGPFVRIKYLDEYRISTPWENDSVNVIRAIVPVYPKIRISYEDIEVIVRGLDAILTLFFEGLIISDLVWDIKLEFSQCFKEYVKEGLNPSEYPNKIDYLIRSLPRYIWTTSCYIGEYRILTFAFDATGVGYGMLGLDIVSHLPEEVEENLVEFMELNKGTTLEDVFEHPGSKDYYKFFSEYLKEKTH